MKDSKTIPMTHSGSKNRNGNRLMKVYGELLAEYKSKEFGYATLAIFGQSCLGGIAAMLILSNDIWVGLKIAQLFIVTLLSMGYNGAVLAQLKPRIAFNLLILSVVFSCIVIIAHWF